MTALKQHNFFFFEQRSTVAYNRCHATGDTRDCAASASNDGSHPKVEITRFEKRTPRPRHRGVRNTDDTTEFSTMRLRRSKKTTEFSTMRLEEDKAEDTKSKDSTETFFRTETLPYTRTLFCVVLHENALLR